MGNSIMATIIRFFDNCDECKSETRSLWKLGIELENMTLCRPCYEFTLRIVNCDSRRHILCKDMQCKNCYNKSLASIEKAFNVDFAQVVELGLKFPRFIFKKSHVKYPFICDAGHRWQPRLNGLAAGNWCSNAQCTREKQERTCMKKYGVKNPMKLTAIREKSKQTCLTKYGVENPMQSIEIKERSTQTCLRNYGVTNPGQSEEIKERIKETCLLKYGVETPFLSEEIKEQIKETCMLKYGVENPFQSEEIKEKIKRTHLRNYGVEYPSQSVEIKEKIKETCTLRYGVENPFQSEEIKERIKQTHLRNYGVEYPSQSEEIKERIRETCMLKYGVEYAAQSEEVKEKMKETCILKYGVENPFQSEEIKEKIKQTHLRDYGVENLGQSEEIKEKIKETCMLKYGVENPMQCPEIFNRNQESAFSFKEYVFPSGRKTKIQGYEHIALNALCKIHDEVDIQTSFENSLVIDYLLNDKKHVYYPDIFIVSKNLIIEVKSTFTYECDKDINELKAQACIEQGYEFQFYIIDKAGFIDIQDRFCSSIIV